MKVILRCILLLLVVVTSQALGDTATILSSGYGEELWTFELDLSTGALNRTAAQVWVPNVTWMEYEAGTGNLYATCEVDGYGEFQDTGVVSRWTLEADGITWRQHEMFPTEGASPAHVTADLGKRLLHVANYVGSSYAAFALDAGFAIAELVYSDRWESGSGVVPDRQNESHPHQAVPFGNFVYVVDLGSDLIRRMVAVEGGVAGAEWADTACDPGSGPRHMTFSADGATAYLLDELRMSVVVYALDALSGRLDQMAVVPYDIEASDPPVTEKGAEIVVHPSERFMYVSHRGTGHIVVFDVVSEADGFLRQTQAVRTTGDVPRHIAISPDGSFLVAVERIDDVMESYAIDQDTGHIELKDVVQSAPGASISVFMP